MMSKTKVACFIDTSCLELIEDLCIFQKLDLLSWRQQIEDMKSEKLLVVSTSEEWEFNRSKLLSILESSKNKGIETVFVSINEEISEEIRFVCDKIYYLPMSFKEIQKDKVAVSLFKRRVNQLLDDKLAEQKENKKTVSVITCTNREQFIENIFNNYNQQEWSQKELIIVLNNNSLDITEWSKKAANYKGISVYQVDEDQNLGACLNFGVSQAKYDYIAKLDDDDYYSPYYLTDMMHAFEDSKVDIVGKKAFFIYFESKQRLVLKFPDLQNRFFYHVAGATLVVKKKVFDDISFRTNVTAGSDALFLIDCLEKGFKLFASDKFNYICIRRTDQNSHTWKIPDKLLMHDCIIFNCKNYQAFVTI